MLAMQRAVAGLPMAAQAVLIDGNRVPALPCPAQAVVKGDGRVPAIAAASILAKVARETVKCMRYMPATPNMVSTATKATQQRYIWRP